MLSVCQKIVLNQIIPKTQGHFVTMATLSVVSNNRPNDYPNWLDGLVFFTDGIPDWYQEQLEWEADKLLQSAEIERINEIEQELKERQERLLLEKHNQEVQQETKRLFQKAFTTFYNKNVVSSTGSKRYNGNSKAKTNLQSFEADAHDDTDSTINKVKPSLRSKFKEVTKERKEINEQNSKGIPSIILGNNNSVTVVPYSKSDWQVLSLLKTKIDHIFTDLDSLLLKQKTNDGLDKPLTQIKHEDYLAICNTNNEKNNENHKRLMKP